MSETITRTNGAAGHDEAMPWILQRAAERRREEQSTGADVMPSSETEADEDEDEAPTRFHHLSGAPARSVATDAGWQTPPPRMTTPVYSPPPPPPPREWDADVETVRAYEPPRPYMPPPPPGARGTDRLAITALILGIVALPMFWVALVGIAAIAVGIAATSRINREGRAGRGSAIAGILLGAFSLVMFVPVAVVAFGPKSDRVAVPATSTAADGRFTPPDGRFTVEFPKSPYRQEDKLTDYGMNIPLIGYGVDAKDYSVAVAYFDIPAPGIPEDGRDGLLEDFAEGTATALDVVQSKTHVTYLDRPAVDLVGTSSKGTIYTRVFIVDDRIYMLVGSGDDGQPAAYDRLLETFTLQ